MKQTDNLYVEVLDYKNPVVENPNLYTYTTQDGTTVYLELENKNSVTYQYTYTVPECAADGKTYTYTSERTTSLNEDKYKDKATNDPNKYYAIGLTDLTFTLKWEDDYDHSARPDIDANYIKSNFTSGFEP